MFPILLCSHWYETLFSELIGLCLTSLLIICWASRLFMLTCSTLCFVSVLSDSSQSIVVAQTCRRVQLSCSPSEHLGDVELRRFSAGTATTSQRGR